MIIKGEEITWSDVFDDKNNKKSIAYGLFGFAHLLINMAVLGLTWLGTIYLSFWLGLILMLSISIATGYWWYRKETKNHTVSLFKERSTPFITLDTRLDFFTPATGNAIILSLWIFLNLARVSS